MDALIATNSVPLAQADTAPTIGTPQYATDGNAATNIPATIWPAYQFNAIQAELLGIIAAAGLAPDRTKTNQIISALQKMFQAGASVTAPDIGTANAYAMALALAPAALTPGMTVGIDNIVATNSGASTLNVNGLGALPIQFPGGGALQSGELVVGAGALFRLNHTGTAWILLESTGACVGPTPNIGDSSTKLATTAWVQLLTGSTSLTANGYRKFPRYPGDPFPLILQWGFATISTANVLLAVTLPIAFPNTFFGVVGNSSSVTSTGGATPNGLASVSLFANNSGTGIYYIALGD